MITFQALCSLGRLRSTWKALRKELTRVPDRDCIDYLEFDMTSPERLRRLQRKLLSGTYQPQHPSRREAAKSQGAFRTITWPAIEDVVVFRLLCDFLYERARSIEPENAFFSRRHDFTPLGKKIDELPGDDYEHFFQVWIRYANYRKHIGLNGLYNFLVTTDISNYFDSIQHPLLLEYLAPFGLPRQASGILGKLLDELRPATTHSPTPAVGLPVDVFECSRTLAHIFLFEHDRRIVAEVGREAYVRWMDDQNVGVKTRVAARRAVRALVTSLNTQRLTLNVGKTRVLTPDEQVQHFWLDQNDQIDTAEELVKDAAVSDADKKDAVEDVVYDLLIADRRGHWDKIALRLLRLAGLVNSDAFTDTDCLTFIVEAPTLAGRVFEFTATRVRAVATSSAKACKACWLIRGSARSKSCWSTI